MIRYSGDAVNTHEQRRCLVGEIQAFGRYISDEEFPDCDEWCMQFYMDDLGHGINEKFWRNKK